MTLRKVVLEFVFEEEIEEGFAYHELSEVNRVGDIPSEIDVLGLQEGMVQSDWFYTDFPTGVLDAMTDGNWKVNR